MSVGVNLKCPAAIELVLDLVESADVLVEGYRPGVVERLGLGPDVCLARNSRLIYARMTGYGQHGPMAMKAGHDLNYIALGGALGAMGRPGESPPPPLNLIGDFGGGGMFLVAGVLAALVERAMSGQGQVVDVAMVDGVASLMAMIVGWRQAGAWERCRGANLIDGGAPFYDTYQTSDGRFLAVAAIEPQFYAQLLELLGLVDQEDVGDQMDHKEWPRLKARFAEIFASRTRAQWERWAESYDACVTPVLDLDELSEHPHLKARDTMVSRFGLNQPAPAPRFSRTPGEVSRAPAIPGADTREGLRMWGIDDSRLECLLAGGAIVEPRSERTDRNH
jgi:alpha-methylacyl-CoA racemase